MSDYIKVYLDLLSIKITSPPTLKCISETGYLKRITLSTYFSEAGYITLG